MCKDCHLVALGFTEELVPVGTHMCLIYTDEKERQDSLLKFLLSGLKDHERVACFSESVSEEGIRAFLAGEGISYDDRKGQNAISISGAREIYFEGGVFDPDRMLKTLIHFYQHSKEHGFPAARVIGEMVPEVEQMPGGERLMEYESRVSLLVKECPVTTVCLYDAKTFDGETILNVLKVHPKMIVNGAVVKNPFFIEPELYLQQIAQL